MTSQGAEISRKLNCQTTGLWRVMGSERGTGGLKTKKRCPDFHKDKEVTIFLKQWTVHATLILREVGIFAIFVSSPFPLPTVVTDFLWGLSSFGSQVMGLVVVVAVVAVVAVVGVNPTSDPVDEFWVNLRQSSHFAALVLVICWYCEHVTHLDQWEVGPELALLTGRE